MHIYNCDDFILLFVYIQLNDSLIVLPLSPNLT